VQIVMRLFLIIRQILLIDVEIEDSGRLKIISD